MLESLEFFLAPFAACLASVLILGYIGMHVLKREVVFIDIAMAQFAAVGALVAHVVLKAHSGSPASYAFAFAATFLAAGFYSFVRRRFDAIPLEAVIGITYAIAAAAALFIVGVAPGGHIHVQHMLAGSILLVTWSEVLFLLVAFAVVGAVLFICRGPLRRISEEYHVAAREGMKTVWWDFVFYALTGVVVTVAVGICGVVVVFAFLIIPATVSGILSDRWGVRLAIAWTTGALASIGGLFFANRFDYSVGPSISLVLGMVLVAVAVTSKAFLRAAAAGETP